MFRKSSKINEFRTWGLLLTLGGMGLMIAGTAAIVFKWPGSGIISGLGLVLGLIAMMASMAIYFWAGMMSTSTLTIECPECGRPTKMVGKTDRCMFCNTILTFDRDQATHQAQGNSVNDSTT